MKGKHSATKNAQLRDELIAVQEELRELKASNRRLTKLYQQAIEEIMRSEDAGIPAVRELRAKLVKVEQSAQNQIDEIREYYRNDMQRCRQLIEEMLRQGKRHNIELLSYQQIEEMVSMFATVFDDVADDTNREVRRNRRRNTAGPDAIRRAMNYAQREL